MMRPYSDLHNRCRLFDCTGTFSARIFQAIAGVLVHALYLAAADHCAPLRLSLANAASRLDLPVARGLVDGVAPKLLGTETLLKT
jgi:hypothetical protein